jgi:hypothetical protein
MLKKVKNSKRGPSWIEVILGAVLSVILGVALGAAYMINRPVTKVTSIPKDPPAGAVYLIEGVKNLNREDVAEMRKSFVDGESMVVDEGDLNGFLASIARAPTPAVAAAKPGDKAAPPEAKLIETSAVNARIHEDKIQFSDTATITFMGVSVPVIVQTTGTFVKTSSGFEFEPESIYVGGCPMQRMIFIRGWLLKKLLYTVSPPDDVATAWSKLADVSIGASKLRLKAP